MTTQEPQSLTAEAILGTVLVVIGAAMLLDKLGLVHSLVQFWPLVLIGGGVALLLERYDVPPRL